MNHRPAHRAAPIPLAAPAARPVAHLVTVALTAIGIVAGHDWLSRMGAIDGPEIIAGFVDWLDGRGWDTVLLPASVLGLAIGLALLFVAVKPRRRTHVRASADVDLWVRPIDVGRIAARAARRCPGVFDASAVAGSRVVTVTADAGGSVDDVNLAAAVRDAAERELGEILAEAPTVKVRFLRPNDGIDRRGPGAQAGSGEELDR